VPFPNVNALIWEPPLQVKSSGGLSNTSRELGSIPEAGSQKSYSVLLPEYDPMQAQKITQEAEGDQPVISVGRKLARVNQHPC
jgi:hypothetical protein